MAHLTIVQADGAGSFAEDAPAGGLWVGKEITMTLSSAGSGGSYLHEIRDVVKGSILSGIQDHDHQAGRWTPDRVGSFRITSTVTLSSGATFAITRVYRVTKDVDGNLVGGGIVAPNKGEIPSETPEGARGYADIHDDLAEAVRVIDPSAIGTRLDGVETAFNVKTYSAVGDGATATTTQVAAAVTAAAAAATAASSVAVLTFPPGRFKIGTTSIPASVAVRFAEGGRIKIAPGATLTIAGDIQAGLQHIFEYEDSTAQVILTSKQVLYPEWWGAKGDDSADDGPAIRRMFALASALGTQNAIHFTSGRTYRYSGELGLYRSGSSHETWVIHSDGATLRCTGGLTSGKRALKLGNSQVGFAEPASVTFNAAAHTITRTTGSWITDGFVAGQQITSEPTSGSLTNHVGQLTIATVTALVLTLSSGLVDEGPKTNVRVRGHVFDRCDFLTWHGLNLTLPTNDAGSVGLDFVNANHCIFINPTVTGFEKAVRASEAGGNSNMLIKPIISGNGTDISIGCDFGPDVLDTDLTAFGSFNNWSIVGGKIQQCGYGVSAKDGVGWSISGGTDFSVCTVGVFKGENASEFVLGPFYTEGIGTSVANNTQKVIELIGSANGRIQGSRISGGHTTGGPDNAGYGIYLGSNGGTQPCYALEIDACSYSLHQQADIAIDSGCRGESIHIAASNTRQPVGTLSELIVVSDATGLVKNDVAFKFTPRSSNPYLGAARNALPYAAAFDFTHPVWSLSGSVTIDTATVLAPDGVSNAAILKFAALGSGSALSLSRDLALEKPLDGRSIVLRFWMKPIGILAAGVNYTHQLRVEFGRDAYTFDDKDFDGCYDGNAPWQQVEIVVPARTRNDTLNTSTVQLAMFASSAASDTFSVAVWGVQIFTPDTGEIVPWVRQRIGFFDAATAQAAPSDMLEDKTGGAASAVITTITDPADSPASADALRDDLVANALASIRNNIATLTSRVKAVEQVQRNVGLWSNEIDLFSLSTLKLWIDPQKSASTNTDGAAISNLLNLRGVGAAFTQTSTARPLYKPTAINGKPGILFDGVNDYMTASAWGTYITAASDVLFAVVKPASIAGGEPILADDGLYRGLTLSVGPLVKSELWDGADKEQHATIPAPTTAFLVMAWHSGGTNYVQVNNGAIVSGAASNIASVGGGVQIGKRSSVFYPGHLGHFGILSVDGADRLVVKEYLRRFYGLW